MKPALKAALISGVCGLVASFLAAYFLTPVPETEFANAFGNAISGLMSGFMGTYMALKPKSEVKK